MIKICMTIIGIPLHCFGFVIGMLFRPLWLGLINGYFYLELKEYTKLLKESEKEMEKANEVLRDSGLL